jgi:hypothetical protein
MGLVREQLNLTEVTDTYGSEEGPTTVRPAHDDGAAALATAATSIQ